MALRCDMCGFVRLKKGVAEGRYELIVWLCSAFVWLCSLACDFGVALVGVAQ